MGCSVHFIPAAGGHPLTVTSVVLCSFQEKIPNWSPVAAETDLQKYSATVQKRQKQFKIQLLLCVSIFLFYSPQNCIWRISWLDASPILRHFKVFLTRLFIHYMNTKTVSKRSLKLSSPVIASLFSCFFIFLYFTFLCKHSQI